MNNQSPESRGLGSFLQLVATGQFQWRCARAGRASVGYGVLAGEIYYKISDIIYQT